MSRLRIPNMLREIATRTDAQIEHKTASQWAGRALALARRFAKTRHLSFLLRAYDARGEAIEHAGKVEDNGRTLGALQRQLDKQMIRVVGAKR